MIIYNYPSSIPEKQLEADIVIPFCERDREFVNDCLKHINKQTNILLHIHLIADGCIFPRLAPTTYPLHLYSSPENIGPFRLTNSLVKQGFTKTPYLIIQDVDDVSYPDRCWKQIAILDQGQYHITNCSMRNLPFPGYKGERHLTEPVIYPNVMYPTTPHGRVVNGTRSMTIESFVTVNGFADVFFSGDFEIDNRLLPLYSCHGSLEILADRTLHPCSQSNGYTEQSYTPIKRHDNSQIMRTIAAMNGSGSKAHKLQTAREIGCLDKCHYLNAHT